MAHTLLCPNGHQTLVADVFAGRTALCSVCGSIVRPEGSAPAATIAAVVQPSVLETPKPTPPVLSEPEDEVELPTTPRAGFDGVYRGLGFHYFKTAACLLATILLGILIAIAIYLQTRPPDWVLFAGGLAMNMLGVALAPLLLLATVLGLIGSVLCLTVPSGTKVRWFILPALLLEILPIALIAVGWLLDLQGVISWPPPDSRFGIGPAMRLGQGIGSICGLLSWTLFLLFLWQLSRFFRERAVAGEALALIGRGWAVVAGWFAVGLLMMGLVWLDAHRRDYDQSLIIGLGLFVLITVPLILWASIWVLRGILDLIGSVRHIVVSRSE